MKKITRTLVYTKRMDKLITGLAVSEGISKAEVIRRALVLYNWLYNEFRNKKRILIINPRNKTARELVFP